MLESRLTIRCNRQTDSGSIRGVSSTAALGFAHNLSRTLIREDDEESIRSTTDTMTTLDEIPEAELALDGAPWAKEGIVARRYYYSDVLHEKKARDKSWKEGMFAVVSDGYLRTFTFGDQLGSGGGDWTASRDNPYPSLLS